MACCSYDCKKKHECAIHFLNVEGECYVEDYSKYGSGTYTDDNCNIEYSCGELGNYKMFVPVKKTIFEKIKAMDIDEFAEWFSKHCLHDTAPCIKWWDDTYCSNCESEIARCIDTNQDMEFAWCELHDKCKFFSGHG